jgi:hypothetical protein
MELQIKETGRMFYQNDHTSLKRYRAVLTDHTWEQIDGLQVGIARKREVLFALDLQGEVCWIRRVR